MQPWRPVLVLATSLLLTACWYSTKPLLDVSKAAFPIAQGAYVEDGSDEVTILREGAYSYRITKAPDPDAEPPKPDENGKVEEAKPEVNDFILVPIKGAKGYQSFAMESVSRTCDKTGCDDLSTDAMRIYEVLRISPEGVIEKISPDCTTDKKVAERAGAKVSDTGCEFTSTKAVMKALAAVAKTNQPGSTYQRKP